MLEPPIRIELMTFSLREARERENPRKCGRIGRSDCQSCASGGTPGAHAIPNEFASETQHRVGPTQTANPGPNQLAIPSRLGAIRHGPAHRHSIRTRVS